MAAPNPFLGSTISHYRIIEKLGGGGMGVVYKAEDTRLGRSVALKFLPEELSQNPQALSRFRREAQAASTLNHPNICTSTTSANIRAAPLSPWSAWKAQPSTQNLRPASRHRDSRHPRHRNRRRPRFCTRQRIIHRDIKPAKYFVTSRGHSKILDFGLAKVLSLTASEGSTHAFDPVSNATQDSPPGDLTSPGSSLGTISICRRNKARGEELDARTDLFSFGVCAVRSRCRNTAFRRKYFRSDFSSHF